MKITPEFLDRPVYTLTVRELIELNQLMDKESSPEAEKKTIELRGIQALASFLKVSATTAQKIKNSGKIPYTQIGRKVLFDGNKVLAALEK